MRYWVIKGNPASNDWDRMLKPGRRDTWHAGRIPADWSVGDRLFCWESAPALRIVGLAVLTDTDLGVDRAGDRLFGVRYLTRRLASMPALAELRGVPGLSGASFLKAGPATTLFPLRDDQANILLNIVAARNAEVSRIWPDVRVAPWAGLAGDVDDVVAGVEGGTKLVSHFARERNRSLVTAKRNAVLRRTGRLECEVCGFDFAVFYPGVGDGFCEVHHRIPLAQLDAVVTTTLKVSRSSARIVIGCCTARFPSRPCRSCGGRSAPEAGRAEEPRDNPGHPHVRPAHAAPPDLHARRGGRAEERG